MAKPWGLWDIEGITVKTHTYSWVQFSCKLRVTNGETEIKNVYYSIFDKIRGITFEEKAQKKLNDFREKMKKKNEVILELNSFGRRLE